MSRGEWTRCLRSPIITDGATFREKLRRGPCDHLTVELPLKSPGRVQRWRVFGEELEVPAAVGSAGRARVSAVQCSENQTPMADRCLCTRTILRLNSGLPRITFASISMSTISSSPSANMICRSSTSCMNPRSAM